MSTDRTKIEVINQDLTSKEGWEEFVKDRQARARDISRKKEVKFVDIALVLRRDPITGEAYTRPVLYMCVTQFVSATGDDDEIEKQKEMFSMQMRCVAVAGAAFASVYRSECWMSKNVKPDEPWVQPRLNPNRVEAILLTTAHRDFGDVMYTADIAIAPGRSIHKRPKRIIGPWEIGPGKLTGRFAAFVPTDAAIADPLLAKASQMYLKILQEKGDHTVVHRDIPTEKHFTQ